MKRTKPRIPSTKDAIAMPLVRRLPARRGSGMGTIGAPHDAQNCAPSAFSLPHLLQNTTRLLCLWIEPVR